MIFISANWVRASVDRTEGINVSVYRSPTTPRSVDGSIDIGAASANSGVRIGGNYSVQPGGNRVRAFLDVATDDQTTSDQLGEFLEHTLEEIDVPAVVETPLVSLSCNAEIGLATREGGPFETLRPAVLRAFDDHAKKTLEPLDVRVVQEEARLMFTLTGPSHQRLLAQRPGVRPFPVGIDEALLEPWLETAGATNPALLIGMVVTTLREEDLAELGGVRLVDEHHHELRRWP